ncbi:hypothetical protein C8R43DRAFT_1228729 [Mycena crocata]|nr:hypothetical protein C8R43DRAFT_1228729 [Mycena crocata]
MRLLPSLITMAAAALPLSSGFVLSKLTNPHSNQVSDVLWTLGPNLPDVFSIFLMNVSETFDLKFVVADTIKTSAGGLTVQLPVLTPSDDYVLYAVNSTSPDFHYASSERFEIFA